MDEQDCGLWPVRLLDATDIEFNTFPVNLPIDDVAVKGDRGPLLVGDQREPGRRPLAAPFFVASTTAAAARCRTLATAAASTEDQQNKAQPCDQDSSGHVHTPCSAAPGRSGHA